jgi:hypothetical protein
MQIMHLDSEYRRRWQEYYLSNGTVKDSRQINWRNVEWEKVVRIDTFINGKKHSVTCQDHRFKYFMCFRWGGVKPVYENGAYKSHGNIAIWTVGWTDGTTCFLKDIDFFTGDHIKDYISPLSNFKGHIHPRVATWQQ